MQSYLTGVDLSGTVMFTQLVGVQLGECFFDEDDDDDDAND